MTDLSTVNFAAAHAKISAHLARTQDAARVCATMLPVLASFDGKAISKRIATAVSKALGDGYRVHYGTEYGMFKLVIWNSSTLPYSDRIDLLLGYDSSPVYDHAGTTEGIDTNPAELSALISSGKKFGRGYSVFRAKFDAIEYAAMLNTLAERVTAYNAAVVAMGKAEGAFGIPSYLRG